MDYLSQHPSAYIRPTSAGSTLGGIARGTKDAITLCKAAGYDYIFIETVGVGQSEYWASNITDLTICLLQPGAGDETQGIKRGLLEMSDILLITKTDGELQELALKAAQSYTTSIQLFPEKINGLSRYVLNTSSINNLGFDVILDTIREIVKYLKENNIFHARRNEQEVAWFLLTMKDNILDAVLSNQDLKAKWEELQKEIYTQNINASIATKEFISYLETFIKK
jgi:LAO/AO transport system kinase